MFTQKITESMKLAARTHVKELKLCEAFLVPKTPANISSLLFLFWRHGHSTVLIVKTPV